MCQEMKKYWDGRASDYDVLFDRAPIRRQIMREVAARAPQQIDAAIDLGAGTGRLTEHLLGKYPNGTFHLVDISARMLNLARTRLRRRRNVVFHETSFEDLPLADSSVDLVFSAFALHHVDDDGKLRVAREIHRVLRPGRLAVIADEMICDPTLSEDRSALDRRMCEVFYPDEGESFFDNTFSDMEEWPTSPTKMVEVFSEAGLQCTVEVFNDIVGILTARKPFRGR